ncbi:hypothetical protein [Spirulina sp. 06S082]|uniref:hypothetical protein n=1 Tax=Spirulina sp. 06S082 TaxID=3110248 RepID=UPI002B21BC88|nr:hypothetical protein [Spirulina sp. 06S082]MEA5467244.1 hypothetical protein [Spirulina sp. 06S082]
MREVVEIFNTEEKCLIEATILEIQDRHLRDFEEIWVPQLTELSEEDKDLDLALKKRLSRKYDDFEVYALECDNIAQGFIAIETLGYRSWFDEQERIIYVKFIVSAPWNRGRLRMQRYKFVGLSMLRFARQRSTALGYSGRVGLHSLPNAIEFYRKARMLELGSDPDFDNLIYFEFGRLE